MLIHVKVICRSNDGQLTGGVGKRQFFPPTQQLGDVDRRRSSRLPLAQTAKERLFPGLSPDIILNNPPRVRQQNVKMPPTQRIARSRSRSPYRAPRSYRNRSRSPTPHRESRDHHKSRRHERSPPGEAVQLPYKAQRLSKRQYDEYKPLFQSYLDIQKGLNLDELDGREARGRWKGFVSRW
jgi:hypothetical protein